MLTLLLLCVLLAVGGLAFIMLARNDIISTLVDEGTAKAIMCFDGFERIIMRLKGHILDMDGNVVTGKEFHPFGGLRFLGIPLIHSLHQYHFRWATYRPQENKVLNREQKIDYILVRDDIYVAEVKAAEAKLMVPLDITLLITARSVNPYKSLFMAQDWMEMLISRAEAVAREYASNFTYEELVAKKKETSEEIFNRLNELASDGGPSFRSLFRDRYGIEISAIETKDINPVGGIAKETQEASTKKWQADREAERISTIANAEEDRINKVYSRILSFGEHGKAIRFMESLDAAGQKAGNWIVPFDLKSVAGNLFGGGQKEDELTKILKEENITPADLREIIKALKGDKK